MLVDGRDGVELTMFALGLLAVEGMRQQRKRAKEGSMATRRKPFAWYYDNGKMDPVRREHANKALRDAGFDGNGRFESIGAAVNAMWGALGPHGLEIVSVPSADRFRGDSGTARLDLGWRDPDDPFNERRISNAVLHVSWTLLAPDRYELIVYVS